MQCIFGVSLISQCVVQGLLFALHVVDIELHTDSSLGCTQPVSAIKRRYEVGVWLERT